LLRKWAKTHLQQCRISKFSGVEPPEPPLTGEGMRGERRGVDRGGEWREERYVRVYPLCVQ